MHAVPPPATLYIKRQGSFSPYLGGAHAIPCPQPRNGCARKKSSPSQAFLWLSAYLSAGWEVGGVPPPLAKPPSLGPLSPLQPSPDLHALCKVSTDSAKTFPGRPEREKEVLVCQGRWPEVPGVGGGGVSEQTAESTDPTPPPPFAGHASPPPRSLPIGVQEDKKTQCTLYYSRFAGKGNDVANFWQKGTRAKKKAKTQRVGLGRGGGFSTAPPRKRHDPPPRLAQRSPKRAPQVLRSLGAKRTCAPYAHRAAQFSPHPLPAGWYLWVSGLQLPGTAIPGNVPVPSRPPIQPWIPGGGVGAEGSERAKGPCRRSTQSGQLPGLGWALVTRPGMGVPLSPLPSAEEGRDRAEQSRERARALSSAQPLQPTRASDLGPARTLEESLPRPGQSIPACRLHKQPQTGPVSLPGHPSHPSRGNGSSAVD